MINFTRFRRTNNIEQMTFTMIKIEIKATVKESKKILFTGSDCEKRYMHDNDLSSGIWETFMFSGNIHIFIFLFLNLSFFQKNNCNQKNISITFRLFYGTTVGFKFFNHIF